MADKKSVKVAIDQNAEMLKQQPGVVGLGVAGKGSDHRLAVYVSSKSASGAIPEKVTITQDGKPGTIDVEVVEVGSLKPST
ncbi:MULTISPECIES: hypothetical protein [Mesorhizobium]|mgnify:CR=1 FL=1|uniref:Uncharacterized protein n=1 Tax=Mesorhizobium denitrificans TaxID=2294114 RepID=A0A371XJF7_9HYPH|nr:MULTISPECIES: hypothetical protein [Mesorhizobium]RFC69343.1 hypothetical protein DY251_00940 [Mesorhizobium denitrificans]